MNYLFHNNKYTKWYFSIIEKRKYRERASENFLEKHHIIPESMGGSNEKSNLVYLTFKEHFIVHLLLVKMCINKKDTIKMYRAIVAFQMFDKNTQKRKINSRQFQKIKEASKIANSKENHPCFGRVVSNETRKKISEANIGEKNGMYGNGKPHSEDHKIKIKQSLQNSEKLKNRGESWKKNISISQSKAIVFISIETNKIVFEFINCNEAAKFLGCNKSNITNALRTERIVGSRLKSLPEKCKVMYAENYIKVQ